MAFLLDTSILVRLANASDAQHLLAAQAVLELHRRGEGLHITPQVLIEFRNVATRPKSANGAELPIADAESHAGAFEGKFPLLADTPDIYSAWKALVAALGVIGKQVHDAAPGCRLPCPRRYKPADLQRRALCSPGHVRARRGSSRSCNCVGGRDRMVKLWDAGGNQLRQFEPFGELVMEVAATHDGGRIVAGDWSGEVRMFSMADGKIVARLAANPPTLDMLLRQRQAEAAAARAVAEQAAREADAAQKLLTEKRRAARTAAAAAAAATKAAESFAAEKATLEKAK